MELSILLMEQIAKLFIMIFMGYAVVKMGLLKDEDSKVLSTLVLYLIVPCVILNAFQVDYTPEKVSGLELASLIRFPISSNSPFILTIDEAMNSPDPEVQANFKKYFGNKRPTPEEYIYKITKKTKI